MEKTALEKRILARTQVIRTCMSRAGSRIFRRGGGRGPVLGGFGLQRGQFSVKMYAKTKELGPVGGACARHAPTRSAYDE